MTRALFEQTSTSRQVPAFDRGQRLESNRSDEIISAYCFLIVDIEFVDISIFGSRIHISREEREWAGAAGGGGGPLVHLRDWRETVSNELILIQH